MSLTGMLIKYNNRGSARRFEAATQDPGTAQTSKLMTVVRQNEGTEYGKRYGFDKIRTIEDYQKQVPIITYNDISDDMTRVTEGAKNVFTAEDPVMFAQTSGTTGKPKFIPVTPADRGRAHSDVMRTWLYHAQCAHPALYNGKVVSLVSPAIEGHAPSGIPYGSTSGHIYRNLPRIITRIYSVPYNVFEIEDYQAKYYCIMRTALEDHVSFLTTANPSSVLKLCEKANEFGDEIIKDIRDGTLSKKFMIRDDLRPGIEAKYRPNPARAKFLEEARARRDGVLMPGDYWKDLQLIGCWKGGTVGHHIKRFERWFNPDGQRSVPVRDWGYLSSECRGSIPLSDDGSRGVLTVASNFFEFVAVDDLESHLGDSKSWTFLTADQIQDGGEYYIFVTTTSGLYRYDINDVIQVKGTYNNSPQIVFLRKGRGMTNITGEKLSVNQLIDAIDRAARSTDTYPSHFKAEADTDRSRYVVRVELACRADVPTLKAFLKGVDDELKSINIEYKAKRDSMRLGSPVLHVMRMGWYENQRKQQVAEGKRAFQAKTELLSAIKQQTMMVKPDLDDIIELDED